jgi:hypothetical protein
LDSNTPSPETTDAELAAYTRWPEIFRSWFWRYYDHLGHLLVYNLGWFLTCFAAAWFPIYSGWLGRGVKINLPALYLLFLVLSVLSVGWAYLVFKVFLQGEAHFFSDFWLAQKKFVLKAFSVAALSGLITGVGLFSIRFYFLIHSHYRFLDLVLMSIAIWALLFWVSAVFYQWPILFFQNPSFLKIFYRSILLVLSNGLLSLAILAFFALSMAVMLIAPFLWFFIGLVFFFSFQCVVLEKRFLRYKITYGNKPLSPFLEQLDCEKERGWRDFFKPWEN